MIFTLSRISDMNGSEIALAMLADWLMVVAGYVAAELPWYLAGESRVGMFVWMHLLSRRYARACACDVTHCTLCRQLPLALNAHTNTNTITHHNISAVFPGFVSFAAFAYVMRDLRRMIHSALKEANTNHAKAW